MLSRIIKALFDVDSKKLSRAEKIKELTATILYVSVVVLAIALTIYVAIR